MMTEEAAEKDDIPLLPVTAQQYRLEKLRKIQQARETEAARTDADIILAERGYDDGVDGEFLLHSSPSQRRKTMLIAEDAVMMILDYLQIYALIMAMAVRWPWPTEWLYATRFLFLVNVDVWEFLKINTAGVITAARDGFIDSNLITIDYRFVLLGWAVFAFASIISYIAFFIGMKYQRRLNLLLQIAKLKRVFLILAQVVAIPLGVNFAKVFHCNADGNMDVHNETLCGGGEHIAYICVAIFLFFGLYVLLPLWMIMKTRTQVFSYKAERHEGYLQLKEAEYAHSLDLIWALNLYHMFSSFRLFWAYYRPVIFFIKFIFIISYATLFWYPVWQIGAYTLPLLLLLIVSLIKWPFRVTSFNPQLFISIFCLLLLAALGVVQNAETSDSVFFQATYLLSELLVINCIWLGFTILWVLFIIVRYAGILCKSKPLWPQMDSNRRDKMAENTQKYMRALLCGRVVLEQALTSNKLFSPAHEVSRQIQIINAYCREAELLNDPIHDTLWDLLDELLEAHSRISPYSLFAESVKPSISVTAKELMKLLPSFKQRLAQREYDFILMSPMKRRMLLKMYALGVFMNGREIDRNKQTFHTETVQRLYNPKTSVVLQQRQIQGDDGMYIDVNLNDESELGPSSYKRQQQLKDAGLILTGIEEEFNEEDDDDDELDIFKQTESDLVSSINDQDMDDLREMMAGIPSRPGTSYSSTKNSLAPSDSRPFSSTSRKSTDASTTSPAAAAVDTSLV